MKQSEYNAGDIIPKEGDPNDVVYKVVSGDVGVFKEHPFTFKVLMESA